MTRLQLMVTQWQDWMRLQKFLCSTNTCVRPAPQVGVHTNCERYSKCCWWGAKWTWKLLPWEIFPMLPVFNKAVPPLQSGPMGMALWLTCGASFFPSQCSRGGSNPALHISSLVKMGFLCPLWRYRTHHKICHCHLMVESLHADCDHIMACLLFPFSASTESFNPAFSLPHA